MKLYQQIASELVRTEAVQRVQPQRHTPLRLQSVAQKLSRTGRMHAQCELVNQVLLTLVELLYETEADGKWSNVDETGRVLIIVPWSRRGYKLWGLRRSESDALLWIMQKRAERPGAWLYYDEECRSWMMNLDYASKRLALAYWRQVPVTLDEWRTAVAATRSVWLERARLRE
jgi:hypothetical protein